MATNINILYDADNILSKNNNVLTCKSFFFPNRRKQIALLRFLNLLHLLVSDRIVALEAVVKDDQGDEIGADTGLQEEITGSLLSPTLDNGEWSCLRLVYQIIWSGGLEVLQRTEGKSFDRPLWSSQEASDGWVTSSIDLQNNTEPYKVRKLKINKSPKFFIGVSYYSS